MVTLVKPLTRDVLAKFLPNEESIRRFEELYQVAGTTTPSNVIEIYTLIEEAAVGIATAMAQASEALDALERAQDSIGLLEGRPTVELGTIASQNIPSSGQVPYVTEAETIGGSATFTFDGNRVFVGDTSTRTGGIFVNANVTAIAGLHVVKTITDAANPSTPAALIFDATVEQTANSISQVYGSSIIARFSPSTNGSDWSITNANGQTIQGLYSGVMGAGPTVGITTMNALTTQCGNVGVSPVGTISNAIGFQTGTFSKQASGAPNLTVTRNVGIQINNPGAGTGSGGLTISRAVGMCIGDVTGAAINYGLLLGSTAIPVSGTWSLLNVSASQSAFAGRVYFGAGGSVAPTARVHIAAGTATASTAPIKLTSGVSLTAAEAGAVEFTTDDLFFTITTGAARKRLLMADATAGLTSGTFPVATTNGRLTDSVLLQSSGNLSITDASNIVLSTGTGTKIGTATTQKLAFWNKAPIVQPTTAIAAAAFVANTSNIGDDTATFGGYTIGQVVQALQDEGLLA